ncbi:NADPH-dependent oxidoreductase [Marinobacter halodurans]|uniref:NADPH-dependent oxidoreductase n=1 Tax=Marinobacter halodurans TaxID=2528979 RepID=A0ABY1ZRS9_9GAMM|nr:NAD(P)H-dependent oxidoreductase [Marinobacter halodurans]TBW58901.1 NADPH-dependent oxidoreductase [Marinobacter halodurans]
MTQNTRILFMAGSTRTGSFNAQLAEAAARTAERRGDIDVTRINLSHYNVPIYNGDLEQEKGVPNDVRDLRQLFASHHGFCIASPEYNSTLSPLLVNTLHWISRPDGDVPGLVAFRGKVAGLVAASPGALGGLRGLVPLRMMLGNIGVQVIPSQLAIVKAGDAFDGNGEFRDVEWQKKLDGVIDELARTAGAIGKAEG